MAGVLRRPWVEEWLEVVANGPAELFRENYSLGAGARGLYCLFGQIYQTTGVCRRAFSGHLLLPRLPGDRSRFRRRPAAL